MNVGIEIDKNACIGCGRCAAACPAGIFARPWGRGAPGIRNPGSCILCGHCADACPADAVIHSEFPPEKVHKIDPAALPSPEQTMLLIKKRRSRRAFRDAPVPEESLSLILEAANRAPTAKNLQNLEYTLVTDPETIDRIEAAAVEVFDGAARKLSNPLLGFFIKVAAPSVYKARPMLEALKRAHDGGKKPILRGAKALLLIHAPKSSMFGREDSNLAYQNASLMAESLNVAQFYTGFLMRAIHSDRQKRIQKLLGIKGKVHAGMALGVPSMDYPNYADRRRARVKRI